jgi:hypothetical protein
MVYEVTKNYDYWTIHDPGRDKERTIKIFQKSKVKVAMHHRAKIDRTGTNIVHMGF